MRRVFVAPERLIGARVWLGADAHKHLIQVLRLQIGDTVVAFDGQGGEVEAHLVAIKPHDVEVTLGARTRHAPARATVVLLQAVARGERMDLIVEKATELGVARVVPVLAARSVPRFDAHAAAKKQARWTAIAREAARQCERADVPTIVTPVALTDALAALDDVAREARFAFLERAEASPLRAAIKPEAMAVALLIGPEGGFTDEERAVALDAGFRAVTLGPRILRTETAAIAAITLAQDALGALG